MNDFGLSLLYHAVSRANLRQETGLALLSAFVEAAVFVRRASVFCVGHDFSDALGGILLFRFSPIVESAYWLFLALLIDLVHVKGLDPIVHRCDRVIWQRDRHQLRVFHGSVLDLVFDPVDLLLLLEHLDLLRAYQFIEELFLSRW